MFKYSTENNGRHERCLLSSMATMVCRKIFGLRLN